MGISAHLRGWRFSLVPPGGLSIFSLFSLCFLLFDEFSTSFCRGGSWANEFLSTFMSFQGGVCQRTRAVDNGTLFLRPWALRWTPLSSQSSTTDVSTCPFQLPPCRPSRSTSYLISTNSYSTRPYSRRPHYGPLHTSPIPLSTTWRLLQTRQSSCRSGPSCLFCVLVCVLA